MTSANQVRDLLAQGTPTRCSRDHDNRHAVRTMRLKVLTRSGSVFETYLCELCALDLAKQPFVVDLLTLEEPS